MLAKNKINPKRNIILSNIETYMKPIVRQLEEKYGGNWKYHPFMGWECEQLNMLAHYTNEGYDMEGNPLSSPLSFKPIRVYGNGNRGQIEKSSPKRTN